MEGPQGFGGDPKVFGNLGFLIDMPFLGGGHGVTSNEVLSCRWLHQKVRRLARLGRSPAQARDGVLMGCTFYTRKVRSVRLSRKAASIVIFVMLLPRVRWREKSGCTSPGNYWEASCNYWEASSD